jgi:hypothetical protein
MTTLQQRFGTIFIRQFETNLFDGCKIIQKHTHDYLYLFIKKLLQKSEKSKINYIQMSRAKMEKNEMACW